MPFESALLNIGEITRKDIIAWKGSPGGAACIRLTAACRVKRRWQHCNTKLPTPCHWKLCVAPAATMHRAALSALLLALLGVSSATPPVQSPFWGCASLDRGVALTFDDGPSEFTPALLDELAALNATAAFFVIVEHALSHPETVRRALREGHTVGLHTRSHPNLTALWEAEDWARLVIEIDDAADDLQSITGERPVYFRPPYGAVNRGLVEYLHDRGFAVALWTSGCIDWAFHSTDRELPAYIDGMQDSGGVLCLHDSCNSTVVGTPDIVAALRSGREAAWVNPQGRELISLDRCTGRETHASGDAAASGHRGVDGAGAGGGMGEDAAAAPSLLGAAAGQRGNGVGARMRAERGAATARRALLQARRW